MAPAAAAAAVMAFAAVGEEHCSSSLVNDPLVVTCLIIGSGLHPAPAKLVRRGYAWGSHHTGITPAKATRLGCPHTPRQTPTQQITEHASPMVIVYLTYLWIALMSRTVLSSVIRYVRWTRVSVLVVWMWR